MRLDVLVAVSDSAWRGVLELALPPDDFATTCVDNGTQALLSIAERRPGMLIVAPDLAGLDGAQVVTGVRTAIGVHTVPMIALLASEDSAARAALAAAGADDVMAPPIDRDSLKARIEAVLARGKQWASTADVSKPPIPLNEPERLAALESTRLFGTPSEERFDRFTRQAAQKLGVQWALISLVSKDGLWHKSIRGPFGREHVRDLSFCGHGINAEDMMVIEDATLDPRFAANTSVTGDPNVRFYAGCPIHTPDGHKIGMLCAIDDKPHGLTESQGAALRDLTRELEKEIAR